MPVDISDYIDVKQRALELGCNVPTELAILPRNFDVAKSKDELVHQNPVPTIRVLWRRAGISETRIEKEGDRFPYVKEKEFGGWLGPVIFVGSSLLKQSPEAVSLALGVISNYLAGWYSVIGGEQKVKLDIVVEQTEGGGYKRIEYEGDVEGLKELPPIVRRVGGYE